MTNSCLVVTSLLFLSQVAEPDPAADVVLRVQPQDLREVPPPRLAEWVRHLKTRKNLAAGEQVLLAAADVQALRRSGQSAAALAASVEYLKQFGGHPILLHQYLYCAVAAGNTDRAEPTLRRIIRDVPENEQELAGLGLAALQIGNLIESERLVRAALKNDPDDAAAAYFLSVILSSKGESLAALEALKSSIASAPTGLTDDPSQRYRTAATWLIQAGRAEEAVPFARMAAAIAPAEAANQRAIWAACHEAEDRVGEWTAIRSLRELAPTDSRTVRASVLSLASLGHSEAALVEAEHLVSLDGSKIDSHVIYATLLLKSGNTSAAAKVVQGGPSPRTE